MKRRDFIAAVLVVPSAIAATQSSEEGSKYGRLTVDGWMAHKRSTGEYLRVYLDGIDVTHSCYEANDEFGEVYMYCRDEADHRRWNTNGARHVNDRHEVCKMRVGGRVIIRPGASEK